MAESHLQRGGETPLLQVREIGKSFPGVRALSRVNLALDHGEVLAVIGENGAGKSTLMKILAGIQQPDEGEIRVEGKQVAIESVETALSLGIALIHQELNLAENLSIGANIFLGREPHRFGLIDHHRIRTEARRFLDMVGLTADPELRVSELSVGQQQMVEIAKALSTDARVLIMDEPTSSLSQREAERLYIVIDELRQRGVSVVYISHRLGEVKRLASRVVVLRDGENAGELQRDEIDHDTMVRLMVGRDVSQFFSRESHAVGEVVLNVDKVKTAAFPNHSVSFELSKGEIVGLAGLVGAGRTELLRAIFGVDDREGGEVTINGKAISAHEPQSTIAAGMGLVPEDRKQHGLILEMSVRSNISLAALSRNSRMGCLLNFEEEANQSISSIEKLRIKTPSPEQIVLFLSGGNQQKVALSKWLVMQPTILLLDEPTRGIDVGAKQEIYQLMHELAGQGMAILFASSEMEEILGVADRVLVMHEGNLSGELHRDDLTEEAVMELATGSRFATSHR